MATISHSRLHRLLSQRPVCFTSPSVCLCDLSCRTPTYSRWFSTFCSHELDDQVLASTADPRFLSVVLTCYPPCAQRLRYRLIPFNLKITISCLAFLFEAVFQVPSYAAFIQRMHAKVESGSVIMILAVTLCVSHVPALASWSSTSSRFSSL